MEDNKATLKQFLNDQMTHQVCYLNVLMVWLHEHSLYGKFTPEYKNIHNMLVDFNTKPSTDKNFNKRFNI